MHAHCTRVDWNSYQCVEADHSMAEAISDVHIYSKKESGARGYMVVSESFDCDIT